MQARAPFVALAAASSLAAFVLSISMGVSPRALSVVSFAVVSAISLWLALAAWRAPRGWIILLVVSVAVSFAEIVVAGLAATA